MAQSLNERLEKPKGVPEKPKGKSFYDNSEVLNDLPPEEMSARNRRAALAGIEKRKALGIPLSIPKGWTVRDMIVVKEMAKEHTQRMINIMAETGVLPDDEGAQEAMGTVLGIMRKSMSQDMKLKAARTVLEYTKSKPTAKHDHTIRSAEDFLDDLANQENDEE